LVAVCVDWELALKTWEVEMKIHNFGEILTHLVKVEVVVIIFGLIFCLTAEAQKKKTTQKRPQTKKTTLISIDGLEILPVEFGRTIEKPLADGQSHFFFARMQKDEVARFEIEEKGVDVILKIYELAGNLSLFGTSNLGNGFAREGLTYIPTKESYILVVVKKGKKVKINETGTFKLTSQLGKKATQTDLYRVLAERLTLEGSEDSDNEKKRLTAVDKLKTALDGWDEIGDKYWFAYTANKIGLTYWKLSNYQQALKFYALAFNRFRELNNIWEQGNVSNNLSQVAVELGNFQDSLDMLLDARAIFEQYQDADSLMMVNSNIGRIYFMAGYYQDGMPFAEEALRLAKLVGTNADQIGPMTGLGGCYIGLKRYKDAQKILEEALKLAISTENKFDAGIAAHNLAEAFEADGNKTQAIIYFHKALLYETETGNGLAEANTLTELMRTSSANPRLAVLYGKLAVNLYQKLRASNQNLDVATQKQFLDQIYDAYWKLPEQLMTQNRLGEAQQVLNSFKDQQHYDFDSETRKKAVTLVMTPRESVLADKLKQVHNTIISVNNQIILAWERGRREQTETSLTNLQVLVGENVGKSHLGDKNFNKALLENLRERTEIKKPKQVSNLEIALQQAESEYLNLLKQAETEFSKPGDEKDKAGDVPDLREMQTALRSLNQQTGEKAVAVYQLVGEENFSALVITPDSIEKVSVSAKNKELNEKALKLWGLLQSPNYDTTILSKKIYDIVFKPLEEKLPKETTTIMWAMDGNLRYLPMAALWDGEKFLAQRFSHVVFTRADSERMTRNVSKVWTGTGFGSSEAAKVEVLGSEIRFKALPGVTEELSAIFKNPSGGIIDGATFPDAQFNRDNFLRALKEKRPLVHIASHFSFRPGDEARSFLLLGDRTAFTLEEMKREANLFQGVELLTLSACNTAATQTGANGREIDGFAELAQRLGAGAVMATLWQVSDASTPWLMREFYANRQAKNGMTKTEALRTAQLALLNGTANTKPLPDAEKGASNQVKIVILPKGEKRDGNQTRDGVEVYLESDEALPYISEGKPKYAHPYYWSPFVLIGNWK
jgi:CHAT domain-containing protein/tetratricopeptide (TPR) repeat protein